MPYGDAERIVKTVRHEGLGAVYKGLIPTTARQVPLNMVRFIPVEWCRVLANVDRRAAAKLAVSKSTRTRTTRRLARARARYPTPSYTFIHSRE